MASDAARLVLVINSGSSSLKYQLVDPDSGDARATGNVDRIGEASSGVSDHAAALRRAFDALADDGIDLRECGLVAVGHRVVHGGNRYHRPTVVDDSVLAELNELSELAPLHNPPALAGIEVARKLLPEVPHVAVFDTGFFHDLPPAAATYAIDRDVAKRWQIRRYGFHGTSHRYVSERVAAFLDVSPDRLNQIVLHLGNGASASAIVAGRAVETSMGLTPLEGLVMGTRSGDIDPSIVAYLSHTAQMEIDDIESMLNERSGVLGLCGQRDFRRLHEMVESGDAAAQLAYSVFIHRLRKYVGAYLAVLGHADVITFTAGIGENDATVRRDALAGMRELGVVLDEGRNAGDGTGPRRISADSSPITVLVIPTNEELAIARDCVCVLEESQGGASGSD